LSDTLTGRILCYRTGQGTQTNKECIIKFPTIDSIDKTTTLVGKKVAWPVNDHKIKGKILAAHGKNGLVRSRFRKGVPGTALLSFVEIL